MRTTEWLATIPRDTWMAKGGVESILNAAGESLQVEEAVGSILPLIDGRYWVGDIIAMRPHRFSLLPARLGYFPVRPSLGGERIWNARDFATAAEVLKTYSPPLEVNIITSPARSPVVKYGAPDGHWLPEKWRYYVRAAETITVTAGDNIPPRYAQPLGSRITINGWGTADEFRNFTVVNLAIVDDFGVAARAFGVHHSRNAFSKALFKAIAALGYRAALPRDDSVDAAVGFLEDWLKNK